MAASRGRRRMRGLGCLLVLMVLHGGATGYEETYTISQLSPKSVSEDLDQTDDNRYIVLETSESEEVLAIEPSLLLDSKDSEDNNENIEKTDDSNTEEDIPHVIVARSAAPALNDRSLRSINADEIASSRNKIDDEFNDVEIHNKRKYYQIHPTKTIDYLHDRDDNIIRSSENFGERFDFHHSGEAKGVPRARAIPLQGPRIKPTAVQPIFATVSPRIDHARQNNPDIQDIITGIVKLLNGNVNVQANTQINGRPGRPMASRINNRGPPRIADAPQLPSEFDQVPVGTPPTQNIYIPTKQPPPYPFDRPPLHGVNLPEQIVPPMSTPPYRPGFHRPIPPWQRPRPRPVPNRRPNPNLPVYKPITHDIPSINSDGDIFILKPTEQELEKHSDEEESGDINIHSNESDIDVLHDNITAQIDLENANTTQIVPEKATEPESSSESSDVLENKITTAQIPITEYSVTTPKATDEPKPAENPKPIEKEDQPTTTTEKAKTEKPIKDKETKKKDTIEKDKIKKEKINEIEKVVQKDVTENVTIEEKQTIAPVIESSMMEKPLDIPKVSLSPTPTPVAGLPAKPNIMNAAAGNLTLNSSINTLPTTTPQGFPYKPYRPRPGIVLDDTEFTPQGASRHPAGGRRPAPQRDAAVITAPHHQAPPPGYGEIFDVTVSAVQGPGGGGGGAGAVQIHHVPLTGHNDDDIIVSASGDQGFVSIDGKRTYLDLFPPGQDIRPTAVQRPTSSSAIKGTGVAVPAELPARPQTPARPSPPRPALPPFRRPASTPRIDTCIVGDDSTCDQTQNEKCKTEGGISSCQCRAGYARRSHRERDPCRRAVAMLLSLRVDRLYERKVAWDNKLADKESEAYQQLSFEALRAMESAFSMTPFSDAFVSGGVNSVYRGAAPAHAVYLNCTVLLEESAETVRSTIGAEIQRHLLGVIRRRSNNVGDSALWVDSPHGSVSSLQDVDECSSPELNDCHQLATCTNTWGGFRCACPETTRDTFAGQLSRAGRDCVSCPASHCSGRGVCLYSDNRPACSCSSGYYGAQCEVDGEVVTVAVGASLAALLVIILTLVSLVMWSRKWSREQKAAGMGSPVFSYMSNTVKTPPVGQPPYQVTLEERMRWAQLAEAMAQANHYAPENVQTMGTRPSSAMFGGYPTLPGVGPAPPVPMPRLGLHMGSVHHTGTMNTVASRANTAASQGHIYGYAAHAATESTSSEGDVQERADLLGAPHNRFQVPRPKSRTNHSRVNPTGIYYDVEYENAPEAIYGTKGIPLSTYTVSRGPPFYRA